MMLSLALCQSASAAGLVDPDAVALFAAMTAAGSTPTAARQVLINNTIAGLKACGAWAIRDVYHFLAAHSSAAALINWKRPGTYNASLVSAPTFTTDQGFAGNGTSSYVDSGFDPSTAALFQGDSATFGVFSRTAAQASTASAGWLDSGTSVGSTLAMRTTSNLAAYRINQNTLATAANTNGSGLFLLTRTGASAGRIDRNGAQLGTTSVASGAVPAGNLLYGRSSTGGFSTVQIALGLAGSQTSAAISAAEYAVVLNYMQQVGAA